MLSGMMKDRRQPMFAAQTAGRYEVFHDYPARGLKQASENGQMMEARADSRTDRDIVSHVANEDIAGNDT